MDDNARPHRANIVDECLQLEDITRMDWPAYSPDLNPIEHVWDMFGRRIEAREPPPTCLPELRRALLDEWCNIPQDQIDNLILRMPMRCSSLKFALVDWHIVAYVQFGRGYPSGRASDSRPEGLGSMPVPPNTLRVHAEYVLVKSVGPKVLWAESRVQGDWRIFPYPSVPCQNCGGGDRWCRLLSSLPRNFAELIRTVICMVLKANDRRVYGPLPR
ncbi:transposable element Tc3 transposase [Trichonephila clavipes]|nr:transposable element Tc3 transposase [Trichonephila clavipes]